MGFHTADGLLFAFSFRKVFVGAPEAFFEGDFRLPLEIAFRFGVVQGGAVDVALYYENLSRVKMAQKAPPS